MLRMGVRSGEGLGEMARSMNDQLCEDLVSGRFITAWLGEIDGRSRTLRAFSAGQGPILHFKAAEESSVSLPVDIPPLGVIAGLDAPIGDAIHLAPGDIVAVMSDGIYEGMAADMSQFGQERVEQLLVEHKGSSAKAIINALQIALIGFCGDRPADDDRTAIIIKAV
jgi:phosphoserine phosphatase